MVNSVSLGSVGRFLYRDFSSALKDECWKLGDRIESKRKAGVNKARLHARTHARTRTTAAQRAVQHGGGRTSAAGGRAGGDSVGAAADAGDQHALLHAPRSALPRPLPARQRPSRVGAAPRQPLQLCCAQPAALRRLRCAAKGAARALLRRLAGPLRANPPPPPPLGPPGVCAGRCWTLCSSPARAVSVRVRVALSRAWLRRSVCVGLRVARGGVHMPALVLRACLSRSPLPRYRGCLRLSFQVCLRLSFALGGVCVARSLAVCALL